MPGQPPTVVEARGYGGEQAAGAAAGEPPARAKGRASLRPLLALAPYLARYPSVVAAAIVALVLAAAATLALPIGVRRMIDLGFSGADTTLINEYFAMMVVIGLVLAVASAARFWFVNWLGERVVADLRRDVFGHLISLSPAFFETAQSGELLSRLTADTTQIKSAASVAISQALRNALIMIGAGVMMVVTSPRLSLMVLFAIPLIVLPLVAYGRAVRVRSRYAQDTLADASAYAGESLGSIRTLQAFTHESGANARFAVGVERAFRAARTRNTARAVLTALAIFLVFASVVGVLWYGAHDVMAGAMTGGRLGQFVLYAVLAAAAMGELSEVWGEISQASGAAERLNELLAVTSDIEEPENPVAMPVPSRGEIAFRSVSFAYPSRPDISALKIVSFEIKPGERVAIVGPSGAGKSTIFGLLLRFYDPKSGKVMVDGVAADRAALAAWRSRIAYVPQETVLFADSLFENIRYGRPDASRADVEAAARAALADDFIRALPEGYETQAGEKGVTLSGGQRQRIAIARAILRDAPILLLDEATSALDAESETLVQRALERVMEGRTSLVIAHRLATVLNADRILVMQDGMIVEEGAHRSLLAAGGLYARLAELQFDDRAAV